MVRHVYEYWEIWNSCHSEDIIKHRDGHCIHHINGDANDNRIENLQKMLFSEHTKLHHTGKDVPQETKIKMSKAQSGKNHPMYGRQHREESKMRMSISQSGEKNHMYGKHHSEETKRKISENHKDIRGKNNPMYGRRHSEETIIKISEAKKRKNKREEIKCCQL